MPHPLDRSKKPNPRFFYIYPDYWKDTWGEKPCLGIVTAESEFHAERRAYDKGLLRLNLTIAPKAVEAKDITPRNILERSSEIRQANRRR